MPFCRECGKDVQDDWETCPHCSCSLTESSQSISIQDSAVGGDVVINDSGDPTNLMIDIPIEIDHIESLMNSK